MLTSTTPSHRRPSSVLRMTILHHTLPNIPSIKAADSRPTSTTLNSTSRPLLRVLTSACLLQLHVRLKFLEALQLLTAFCYGTASGQMALTPNAPPPVQNIWSDEDKQNRERLNAHWASNSQDWNLDSPALAGMRPNYSPWLEETPPSSLAPPHPQPQQSTRSFGRPPLTRSSSNNGGHSGRQPRSHKPGWKPGHQSRASRELQRLTASTPTEMHFSGDPASFGLQQSFALGRPSPSPCMP